MKKKVLFGLLVFMLVALPLFAACAKPAPTTTTTPSPTTAPAKTLKIGAMLSITGAYASDELEGSRELDMFVDMINEKGGITVNGEKYNLELITVDCQSTLDGVVSAANKLVYDDKVKFVCETVGFLTVASNEIFESNKVVHICPYNTLMPEEMNAQTPYKFLSNNSAIGSYLGIIDVLKYLPNVKTIVFLNPDDGTVQENLPILKKIAEDNGYTVYPEYVLHPVDMVDFSPIVAKIHAMKDVDAIVDVNSIREPICYVTKLLRSLGDTRPVVSGCDMNCDVAFELAGAEGAKNILFPQQVAGLAENPPLLNELCDRIEAKYGPSVISANCPNGVYMLVQAIEAAQSLDPTVVAAQLESMDTIDTLYGVGTMGGLETYGIKHAVGHPQSWFMIGMDGKCSLLGWIPVTIP